MDCEDTFMRSFLPVLLPVVVMELLICLLSVSASAQRLECSPCSYDFGDVNTGTPTSHSIQLSNTGTAALTIVSMSNQGSAFSSDNFRFPMTLDSRTSVELPVIFTPTATGYTDGTFTLTSNSQNPTLAISVSGTGTGTGSANRKLTVSPATLNFGSVTVGSSASLKATLTASKAAVTISSDRSTSSEFSIVGLDLPVTIQAGKSTRVTIQFTPSSSGTDPAKVGFISNATNSPTLELVTGTGVVQNAPSVYLSWDGVSAASGYNVFRGTAKPGPFHQINTTLDSSTNYTDSTVVAGNTYYYVTTAVNAQGEQSGYSNVTEAAIPSP
jgi:ASPM-SPD-2-Hydin domain-containing protein/HYDIN/CFA65/VesB family protein